MSADPFTDPVARKLARDLLDAFLDPDDTDNQRWHAAQQAIEEQGTWRAVALNLVSTASLLARLFADARASEHVRRLMPTPGRDMDAEWRAESNKLRELLREPTR
jgi:hypothetical protein